MTITKITLLSLLVLPMGLWAQNAVIRDCPTAGSGSGTTYTASYTVSPGLITNHTYCFQADMANSGAATINFNSLGAKSITKVQGGVTTALVANDIRSGQVVVLAYDGTRMQMTSQLGNAPSGGQSVTSGGGDWVFQSPGAGQYLQLQFGVSLTPYVWPVKNAYGSWQISQVSLYQGVAASGKFVAVAFYDHSKNLISGCTSSTASTTTGTTYNTLTFSGPCTITDPNPYVLMCTDSTVATWQDIDYLNGGFVAGIANNGGAQYGSAANPCTLATSTITAPATIGTITGVTTAYRPAAYWKP